MSGEQLTALKLLQGIILVDLIGHRWPRCKETVAAALRWRGWRFNREPDLQSPPLLAPPPPLIEAGPQRPSPLARLPPRRHQREAAPQHTLPLAQLAPRRGQCDVRPKRPPPLVVLAPPREMGPQRLPLARLASRRLQRDRQSLPTQVGATVLTALGPCAQARICQ